jgi:hypothetical protein
MAGLDQKQADGGGARFRGNRHEYDYSTGWDWYKRASNASSGAAREEFDSAGRTPGCR